MTPPTSERLETLMALLMINIRNAWDLLLSMARRRGEAERAGSANR